MKKTERCPKCGRPLYPIERKAGICPTCTGKPRPQPKAERPGLQRGGDSWDELIERAIDVGPAGEGTPADSES